MLHASVLMLSTVLGFTPADDGWLDVVPAEADVAVRISGMESVKKDLSAMIGAMSPNLAKQADAAMAQGFEQFRAQYGEAASTQPFVLLVRAAAPEKPEQPPFAVVVRSDSYEGVLKSLNGGKDVKLEKQDGGYDSFEGPGGAAWYAVKSDGRVAFGPDKALVAAVAKSEKKPVGKSVAKVDRERFDRGDVGVYVNLDAVVTRYSAQIDGARKALMMVMDQAGGAQGGEGMLKNVKTIYAAGFDALKSADVLTISFDAAGEGLAVDGAFQVKSDSPAAKLIADAKASDAEDLGKLCADASYYVYMNIDAKQFQKLQNLGLGMLSSEGKPSEELEKSIDKLSEAGRIESVGSVSMTKGILGLNVTESSSPEQILKTTELVYRELKDNKSPLNIFKDVTVTPNAQEYRDYNFTRVDMTLDTEKLGKMQPGNPGGAAAMLKMYGGDKISTWYAAKDKKLIQVTAPDQDRAKEIFDKYLDGKNTLAETTGYKTIRSKLGKEVNLTVLASAQGIVGQVVNQVGAALNKSDLKVPADLPEEPALIGASVTLASPTAIEFKAYVPSAVGPVFEKGFTPMVEALRGNRN